MRFGSQAHREFKSPRLRPRSARSAPHDPSTWVPGGSPSTWSTRAVTKVIAGIATSLRGNPVLLTGRGTRAVAVLVVLEVLAALLMAVHSARDAPVFATGDEGYHLAYAVSIAEGRGLPVVGQTLVPAEVLAIQDGSYPGPPRRPAGELGFRGLSYEAFQPPLYYAVAAPFTLLADDWRDKVLVLRGLAVGLIAVALALLLSLCRLVRPTAPLPLYAVALVPFLLPSMRQQEVLVSNDVLLVPLALALACAAWRAGVQRSLPALVAAGVLVGLLLLTKLTAVWAVPVLGFAALSVLRDRATLRRRVPLLLAGVGPVVMLGPWLLQNLSRYGALTANDLILQLQAEVSPPSRPSPLQQSQVVLEVLVQAVLGRRDPYPGWVTVLALVLGSTLLAGAVAVLLRPSATWPAAVALALPLPLQVVLLSVLSVQQGTQLLYERYLHPVIPLAVVATWLGAAAVHQRLRRGRALEDEQVVEPQLEGPVQR